VPAVDVELLQCVHLFSRVFAPPPAPSNIICFFIPCYLLCFCQDMPGMQSRLAFECKTEVDDKSTALMLSASEDVQHHALLLGTSASVNVPPHLGTGIESSVKSGQAVSLATSNVNNIDYTTIDGDFKADSSVKPTGGTIGGNSFADTDAAKVSLDNQTLLMKSVDSRNVHLTSNEVPAFDSGRRVRWFSGVSCTSSSTSGGEESPRPGSSTKNYIHNASTSLSEWFSNSCPPQHQAQTSTPVNGWFDSSSTQSQHISKEENDVSQQEKSSASIHGLSRSSSMSSVPVDGISRHKSSNNLNAGVGFSSVTTVDRLHPGIGHIQENRPWLSSNTSPESRWNSRASVREPFWASTAAPFYPVNEGVSSPIHSPQSGASLTASVHAGSGGDGGHVPVSFNGSFSDATNSVQMAQNLSPSTPVATTPSKKRVCVPLLLNKYLE